jgi:cyclin-dependent kinase 12/13
LGAEYFFENPIVKPAADLNMKFAVQSVHEMDCRKKFEQNEAKRKAQFEMARNAAAADAK